MDNYPYLYAMDYKQLYDKSQKMYNSLHILFQDQLQAKDQQLQELANRIKELGDRIDYLTQQLYGSKSEKSRLRLPKNTLTTTAPAHVISPDNAP
ncbi:MAG: hypothetical protein RR407_09165, partial [Bacteroidales bacterium]